ncbi:hypothetical protein [Actinomycetospora lemnae]|uniref:Uncharacterized protein n=1 Tax=Actinomycetospora lemnae TaxID=3019891 RepID=A0ABT5SY40_9PSEU|nr:hypothetical protein [Actinomycetospora sp. DW7H6]MDD7967783.1 hypothetical protein [Actinomycetospora sp. DW7H6]
MTAETRRGPFWRLGATALLAATLGIAGHVVGAGELPTDMPVFLGVVGIAAGATGLAQWSGARRRWCWEAITLLWFGQLAVETLLICHGSLLGRPLEAAGVHVAAGLLAGGLLLGGRRILDDTISVLDVLLPRWWAVPAEPTAPTRTACASPGPAALRAGRGADGRTVRGPPRPA